MGHVATTGGDMRILLIEDGGTSPGAVDDQLQALGDYGLQVVRKNVTDATTCAFRECARYDALLLDLGSIPGNEKVLLNALFQHIRDVPVIALVKQEDEHRGADAIDAGATDYLLKEFGCDALSRLVKHAVERARMQSRLRESQMDHSALFKYAAEPMAIVASNGVVSHINRRMQELLGYTKSEVQGQMLWTDCILHAGFHRETILSWYKRQSEQPLELEMKLLHRCGQGRNLRMHLIRMRSDSSVVVTGVQLAEQEQSAPETGRHFRHLEALFEAIPEGIVAFDNEGNTLDINPAFVRMFGFERDKLRGVPIRGLIMPERLRPEGDETMKTVLQAGCFIPQTKRRRADGREVDVSVLGAPILVDGVPDGGLCVYRDITASLETQERLEYAFIDLVETTLRAVESVDPYTAGHQRRVARLADLVGRRLGMDDYQLQGLYVGSILHDIGKLSLPSTILTKPGRLSPEEWNLLKSHCHRGHTILAEASLPWPVMDMALRHHERLDGSGYPDGLTGDALSLSVRILGVCDVVEAMTADRPYRQALGAHALLQELRDGAGIRYDKTVVDLVMQVFDSGEFQLDHVYRNDFWEDLL